MFICSTFSLGVHFSRLLNPCVFLSDFSLVTFTGDYIGDWIHLGSFRFWFSRMSGEEDEKELELKDLIVQTLEANGLLSKIKAQIRASVFSALDENDRNMVRQKWNMKILILVWFLIRESLIFFKNNVFENPIVKKHLESKDGKFLNWLTDKLNTSCSHGNGFLMNLKGRLAFAVVREFLENCNLDFTLSVMDPELNVVSVCGIGGWSPTLGQQNCFL